MSDPWEMMSQDEIDDYFDSLDSEVYECQVDNDGPCEACQ